MLELTMVLFSGLLDGKVINEQTSKDIFIYTQSGMLLFLRFTFTGCTLILFVDVLYTYLASYHSVVTLYSLVNIRFNWFLGTPKI